jgi:hypothetical protein
LTCSTSNRVSLTAGVLRPLANPSLHSAVAVEHGRILTRHRVRGADAVAGGVRVADEDLWMGRPPVTTAGEVERLDGGPR